MQLMEEMYNGDALTESSELLLEGVSKVFQSQAKETVSALRDVNMGVRGGQFVSLVGPSGCGKSTLLRITGGLIPPSSGSVTFAGEPVREPPERLGMVFQDHVLLPWRTVLQNTLLPAQVLRLRMETVLPRIDELLSMVGLDDAKDKYPHELSGGMRQRCALVRALAHDPLLLLMDEPFGALDAMTRERLNLELERLWLQSQKSVIFVTHSISEAVFLSDRVLIMRKPSPSSGGSIVADVAVELARPRSLEMMESREFIQIAHDVRRRLEADDVGPR